MRTVAFAATLVALFPIAALAAEPKADFKVKPTAAAAGKDVRITFEAAAATDVEVAVVDVNGRVVRHLAAGALGANAPDPLKKNS
ncbi:MAG: hypothetical protein PHU85_17645, partial [Phycisphaerae bacterium]|nr:hypothetical protein [Phycisphaerae bacterium]